MDKDDLWYFATALSVAGFFTGVACIARYGKVGYNDSYYLAFSIFTLIVEIAWLIGIPINYIKKYEKVNAINRKYYEVKESIYNTLTEIKTEFCNFYIMERKDEIPYEKSLLKISEDHNIFKFKGVDGTYHWCTFDKSVNLQENHIQYYLDAIDNFVYSWNLFKGNTSDTCHLVLLRNDLYKLRRELEKVEYDMRCI